MYKLKMPIKRNGSMIQIFGFSKGLYKNWKITFEYVEMKDAKSFISKIIVNKLFWQFVIAVFMIVMAVFFISHEHLEFFQIKKQLDNSNPWYIMLGISLTVLFVLIQGQMYVQSFRALGPNISLITASRLFLKRNFVSVFLPAGGFSSLMFFTSEVEKEGAEKSQIHLASTFFGIISLLSVIVVAIPTLAFAFILHDLQQIEIYGFFFLLLLAFVFIVFVYSVSKKGFGYRILSRIRPSIAIVLDEMVEQEISRRRLFYTLCLSVVIEIIGILHLYVAMLALGFEPSFVYFLKSQK